MFNVGYKIYITTNKGVADMIKFLKKVLLVDTVNWRVSPIKSFLHLFHTAQMKVYFFVKYDLFWGAIDMVNALRGKG